MAARVDIPPEGGILAVDLAFIGDLLMTTPALTCLRRAFPRARIDILVAEASRPVIEHNPDVNNVINTQMKRKGWRSIRKEAARMADGRYDLAISLHRAHASALMPWLAGIPRRIGFTNAGRGLFLTGGIPFELHRHRAHNHLQLIEKGLGIDVDYSTPMRLDIDPNAAETIERRLEEAAPGARLVAINPNASWPTKQWRADGFAWVADRLAEDGCLPVLIGSPQDRPIADEVNGLMRTEALDFTGKTTLQELAALLSQCSLMVTNDSGPMHMAHAVGTPVVPVFGPTDPARCGPWLGQVDPLQAQLDCIKCYRKRCWHLTCMREVVRERVLDLARRCIRSG